MIASSKSRDSSKNMPRFSSNDMVHNHYLDEARKKTQERDRNSKTNVIPSARFQSTADGSKPKPRSTNHSTRSLPIPKSSCVTITAVPKADHSKSSSSFLDSKHFISLISMNANKLWDVKQAYTIHVQKEQSLDLSAELESLFGHLFDEYFNGVNQVVSKSFVVTAADASVKRQQQPDSTSSTSTLATTVTADRNFDFVDSKISLIGFPAQSIGSSNTDVLDSPCLLVLITGTSQSRQHVSTSLIHIESCKSPTKSLFVLLAQADFHLHCNNLNITRMFWQDLKDNA
ncbi:hypothetical protein Tco_0410517 [Tanacetum coccineum]